MLSATWTARTTGNSTKAWKQWIRHDKTKTPALGLALSDLFVSKGEDP